MTGTLSPACRHVWNLAYYYAHRVCGDSRITPDHFFFALSIHLDGNYVDGAFFDSEQQEHLSSNNFQIEQEGQKVYAVFAAAQIDRLEIARLVLKAVQEDVQPRLPGQTRCSRTPEMKNIWKWAEETAGVEGRAFSPCWHSRNLPVGFGLRFYVGGERIQTRFGIGRGMPYGSFEKTSLCLSLCKGVNTPRGLSPWLLQRYTVDAVCSHSGL